jgi:hypothetical protein
MHLHRTAARRSSRRLWSSVATMSLFAAVLAAPAAGAPINDCPTIMSVDRVNELLADAEESGVALTGTGYTVSRGTQPEPFQAEVLGVLPGEPLPGRDIIVAELHSPAIDEVGGVWAGMSGSPVYITDNDEEQLLGAVAYSFSYGASFIAGLTPAAEMERVRNYGSATGAAARVHVDAAMRRTIATAIQDSAEDVGSTMGSMRVPVRVPGAGPRALERAQRKLDRRAHNVRLLPGSAGSSAADSSATASAADFPPGSNFAAALSYGDLTLAGVGTTTYTCDGKAMAFGHPFFFEGKTRMGANTARAITVIPDAVFGSYKLATVGASAGAVDQDRGAGIRADFGQPLDPIPVTSTTAARNTGNLQQGSTQVTVSNYLPFVAWYHQYLQIIDTMDQFSEGSAEIDFTITGTREDGTPWRLRRSNVAASRWEIAYEALHEFSHMIDRLESQSYEEIDFTGVEFNQVNVRQRVNLYRLTRVRVAKDDGPYREVRRVRARPGTRLHIKARLNPYEENQANTVADMTVRIPKDARSNGVLRVFGGPPHHTGQVGAAASFDDLLEQMRSDLRNDTLSSRLILGGRIHDRSTQQMDQTVTNSERIRVTIID